MNKQEMLNTVSHNNVHLHRKKYEARRFQRYRIKRRVLLKDPDGRIFSGLAYDISKLGLHLRCTSQVAFELLYNNKLDAPGKSGICEIKISLPYMNKLTECAIYCKVTSHQRHNDKFTRLGIGFHVMDADSKARLNYFLNNLSHWSPVLRSADGV